MNGFDSVGQVLFQSGSSSARHPVRVFQRASAERHAAGSTRSLASFELLGRDSLCAVRSDWEFLKFKNIFSVECAASPVPVRSTSIQSLLKQLGPARWREDAWVRRRNANLLRPNRDLHGPGHLRLPKTAKCSFDSSTNCSVCEYTVTRRPDGVIWSARICWERVYLSERIGSERVGRAESLCALLLGVTYKPCRF